MKKFLLAVIDNTAPISKKLLFTSFIAGYLLATIFFDFFRPQVHQFLNSLLGEL